MTATSIRRRTAPFLALFRKDLRDVRTVFLVVVALDLVILAIAHRSMILSERSFAGPALPLAAVLTALTTVPVVAELFTADHRTGIHGALRGLPARMSEAFASKCLVTLAIVVGSVSIVVVGQDVLYALGLAADVDRMPPAKDAWTGELVLLLSGAIAVVFGIAAGLALLTRSALSASIGTVLAVCTLVGIATVLPDDARSDSTLLVWIAVFVHGASTPFGAAVGLGGLASLSVLRGRVARSGLRRVFVALLAPIACTVGGAAGLMLREALREPIPFDHPEADVDSITVSPDGQRAAFVLRVAGRTRVDHALFVADLETGSIERLPSSVPFLRAWLPIGRTIHAAGWTPDGREVLVEESDARGYLKASAAIDPGSKHVEPRGRFGCRSDVTYAGAPVRYERGGWVVTLEDGTDRRLRSIPRVPARTPGMVLHIDGGRELRRLDRRTGEDVTTGVEVPPRGSFWPGPGGGHVVVHRRNGPTTLHDLASGASREVEHGSTFWSRDGASYLRYDHRVKASERRIWSRVSMDGEEPFDVGVEVQRLEALAGGRWLGIDVHKDALYLFDADGSHVRTIREGR